jgi:hypothetical protein
MRMVQDVNFNGLFLLARDLNPWRMRRTDARFENREIEILCFDGTVETTVTTLICTFNWREALTLNILGDRAWFEELQ